MQQKNISCNVLRKIIRNELKSVNESIDHAGIRDVVNAAQKLLGAVESFKKDATPAAINAVTPQLDQIEKVLEDMLSTPASYVQKTKTFKKVSLRPQTQEEKI